MSSPPLTELFVPGWGAPARLYVPGLPEEWHALELPSFRKTRGDLSTYRAWLVEEIAARGPVALAGHSMGAALALLAAIDRRDLVERLILLSPAGLPLTKPIPSSLATWAPAGRDRPLPPHPGGTFDLPDRARAEERATARPFRAPARRSARARPVSRESGPVHRRRLHDRHDDSDLALPRARGADRCRVPGGRRARRSYLADYAPGPAQGRALTLSRRSPRRPRR